METSVDTMLSIARKKLVSGVSNTIFHIVQRQDGEYIEDTCMVMFASPFVVQKAFEKMQEQSETTVLQVMAQCAGVPALYGQMFESFCHLSLTSGCPWLIKSLGVSSIPELPRRCETKMFLNSDEESIECGK